MTILLIALMLLYSTAGAQVKPAVMPEFTLEVDSLTPTRHPAWAENTETIAAKLQRLDYRITGLWVENQRLRIRIDSLEAKLSRAHIVAVRDSEYVKVETFLTGEIKADTVYLWPKWQWEKRTRYKISFDPEEPCVAK